MVKIATTARDVNAIHVMKCYPYKVNGTDKKYLKDNYRVSFRFLVYLRMCEMY